MRGWPIDEVWLPRNMSYKFRRGRMVRCDPYVMWEKKLYRRYQIDLSTYRSSTYHW